MQPQREWKIVHLPDERSARGNGALPNSAVGFDSCAWRREICTSNTELALDCVKEFGVISLGPEQEEAKTPTIINNNAAIVIFLNFCPINVYMI